MTASTRKSYGWRSVRIKPDRTTVLGDDTSKISLYRDGDNDELSVHKDETTGLFTAVFYGKDGTRLIDTGDSEEEATNKVRPPRV